MKRINIIKSILFASTLVLGVSCTNLDEQISDGVPTGGSSAVNTAALLTTAYNGLRNFQDQGMMFTMDEMSGDGLVGPTRGGDWDDNAKWRQFQAQSWTSDNAEILNAWNNLLSGVYNCNVIIENSTVASEITQARFLRAFYYFNVVDLFGQAPYREPGTPLTDDPKVWSRPEAIAYVISELEAILPSLPARIAGDASIVNADAGHFLLAKIYLNLGVYMNATPAGPYVFQAADMNKVIAHVEAINSSLAVSYWENFAPTNNVSPEILFSSKNSTGGDGGPIQSRWRMGMHYNQTPDGWNGFTTMAEYYDRFNAADERRQHSTPSIISNFGNPIGFQYGQMYAPDKYDKDTGALISAGGTVPLKDRTGAPLFFTKKISLIVTGPTIETAGIRAQKYEPDIADLGKPGNDYVLMRYSDALLMEAEAILRGGAASTNGSPQAIMDKIALRTGVPAPTASLENVYAERGRELWWEGWRRNDMIRFEKFLLPRELKTKVSDPKYLLYSIPSDALFNPNIKQNPGY
ncbi:RagB/SusD family nutrient uptake outer membrane protein [Flavobacterium sp. N3904]|uniref:RagB/SusD family nutrient uptake outer membrane protein n=1 Tax=Flavobacterium sp. N3904 TaxID=2986835 RepID=UPI0022255320|nr:RagB/SusD family nutrient uptake outer membrane protein [Flavobacterium sp. N3904]